MKNIAFAFPMHYRTIAIATMVALLAWTLGLPAMIHNANAAAVEDFSDTLSDSDFGVDATHTVRFTLANAVAAGETMVLTFDPTDGDYDFDLDSVTTADVTVSGGSITQAPNVGTCLAATDVYVSAVNDVTDYVEVTVCPTATITAGTDVVIVVGGNGNFINNPATVGSYVVSLAGTMSDSGDTRVVVVDDVTVTADVDTIFTFTIVGLATTTAVNDDAQTTTTGATTPTAIPFGTIAPGTPKLMAQELRVDTNALNGFSVSVFADQTLTSGNGATIDPFIDASQVASSTLWASPSSTMGDTNTYGHWGLTSDDNVVSNANAGFWGIGEAAYVGNFINNPVEVFYNPLPVTFAQGPSGEGHTIVGYKVDIGVLQEAAKDYTATLTYIATPVF